MVTKLPAGRFVPYLLESHLATYRNGGATHSLFPEPPSASCRVIVVIPVRNERSTIGPTIQALARQGDHEGARLNPALYEVLILVNNTTDGSAAVAREAAEQHPFLSVQVAEIDLPEPHAHVGQARRVLMDAAHDRFVQLDRLGGVIATTDADTLVSPTWIRATLDAVERGADAVGGRILVSEHELRAMDPDARLYHLQDVGYRYLLSQVEAAIDPPPGDPWPRHFQHFGASIAVTANAYRLAGGLPVRSSLEDVAFYHQLVAVDAVIRHCPDVRVYTSARQTGRTDFGFAIQLRQWSKMKRRGACFLVRSPEDMVDEFQIRRALREAWQLVESGRRDQRARLTQLTDRLVICPDLLLELADQRSSFGLAWQQLHRDMQQSPRRGRRFPQVEIHAAIRHLRHMLSRYRIGGNGLGSLEDIQPVQLLPSIEQMM